MSTREYDHRRQLGWDWAQQAACSGLDTELFYQADKERGVSQRLREARAKAICAVCPVIDECLRDALRRNEPHGVWGGLTSEERLNLIKSQPA